VVFLLDVFDKPASEKTIQYIDKLVDAGVHVVFLTWRPHKGAGSADEILLSGLKHSRTNPILVVSYNGGRIALHSKAQNPTPVTPDAGAFRAENIEFFRGINAKVQKALGLSGLDEQALPAVENALTYMVRLPDSMGDLEAFMVRARLISRYNQALRGAGLPYKMEAHPDDARLARMASLPMRFSIDRVMDALDQQFRGEGLADNPSKFLLLTDSKKSPRLSLSFPPQVEIQVVGNAEDVENAIGAAAEVRELGR